MFIIERSELIVLVFYYKGMLEKVTMQRTQQLSAFPWLPKEVKCSACVGSQNIAIECGITVSEFRLFLENHSLEFHEIWHENTLAKQITGL